MPELLRVFANLIKEHTTNACLSNYRHCVASYNDIFKTIIIPETKDEPQKLEEHFLNFLSAIACFPQEIYAECFLLSETVLDEAMNQLANQLTEASIKEIDKLLQTMKKCQAKDIFIVKFEKLFKQSKSIQEN